MRGVRSLTVRPCGHKRAVRRTRTPGRGRAFRESWVRDRAQPRRRGGDDERLGGEDERLGGDDDRPVDGLDGAARGADGRLGVARGVDVRFGAERVVGADRDGGDTVRVVERGGDTSRPGVRRSRLPPDDRLVLPDPTVPCGCRPVDRLASVFGASPFTRRGVISRMPLPAGRRASDAPDVGCAGTRPRVTSPVTGVDVEGMTSRRPVVAPLREPGVVGLDGVSTVRRRPLTVGSVVDGVTAVPVGRRRASSEPLPVRGVAALAGADVTARRPVFGLTDGVDAKALPLPVRRRAVTAPWLRPYRSVCDLKAYEPHAPRPA